MALKALIDLLTGNFVLVTVAPSGGPTIPSTAIQFIDGTYFEGIDGGYLEFLS